MTKKISGAEYALKDVFSSSFKYEIPSYQRPYSWTTDQASELFGDLYDFFLREREDSYFLGSIVLIKEEGNPNAQVIDGQQRLTTLTILLGCLASFAPQTIRDSILKYLREPGNEIEGLEPKPRLSLRLRDKDFFERYVQNVEFNAMEALDPAQLDNESQKNIRANAKYFCDKIRVAVQNEPDFAKSFASFLATRCILVVVSTPNEQSAFRIFSVLNSRGLDLLPTDIIKSTVIGGLPSNLQDQYTEKWEELEVQTGRNGFAELFTHIRMIYAKTKSRRSLLDEFREQVIGAVPNLRELMSDVIEPYADAYLVAKKCEYRSTENAAEINSLLRWLNRIDNSDWLPSAIEFIAKNKNEHRYIRMFLGKLERLAAFLHICEMNVNDRIERYALVLAELKKPHSFDNPITSVELTDEEKTKFKTALNGNIYEQTARRRNYLILRLDSFLADGAATYDPTLLTIEHVLPQTVDGNSEWARTWQDPAVRKEWTHRLANLVPLTQRRNSQAQNYDFDRKKTAYFRGTSGVSSYALTTQVLNTSEWSLETVRQRQTDLLGILERNWGL